MGDASKKGAVPVSRFKMELYHQTLWICITGSAVAGFVPYDMENNEYQMTDMDGFSVADTDRVYDSESGDRGVLMRFSSRKDMDTETICHESVHAALLMFEYIGGKVDFNNQEVFAYLVGWIADCCEKAKNYKVEKK